MSEDESWRSEAAYDYIDALTPGDLAWEFLRRNPDYRKSYRELIAVGRLSESAAREFAANEYLGATPTANGIASGQVAAIAFDVVDPSPRVTAFTFEFR